MEETQEKSWALFFYFFKKGVMIMKNYKMLKWFGIIGGAVIAAGFNVLSDILMYKDIEDRTDARVDARLLELQEQEANANE